MLFARRDVASAWLEAQLTLPAMQTAGSAARLYTEPRQMLCTAGDICLEEQSRKLGCQLFSPPQQELSLLIHQHLHWWSWLGNTRGILPVLPTYKPHYTRAVQQRFLVIMHLSWGLPWLLCLRSHLPGHVPRCSARSLHVYWKDKEIHLVLCLAREDLASCQADW